MLKIEPFGFTKFGTAFKYTVISNKVTPVRSPAPGGLRAELCQKPYHRNGLDTASGFTYLLPAKPFVIALSPASGSIGTNITITGNNFNTVVAQNIVHFEKVKATVLSATDNQIVCTVPAGASFSPVTIVNLGTGLMGASAKPFAVTFESHNFVEPGSFKKALVIPHERIPGLYPWYMTIGDIDTDGKNDLSVVMRRENINNSLFIYRNKSTPNNFVFDQKLWVAHGTYSAIADINNDGLLDLMVGNTTGSISVLINAGSTGGILSFKPPINISGLNGVSNLCVGDVNGDGRADLIMAGFDDRALGILQNTSFGDDISFANLLRIFPGGVPRSVTLADLDADGENEIVAAVNGNGWNIFPSCEIPPIVGLSCEHTSHDRQIYGRVFVFGIIIISIKVCSQGILIYYLLEQS